MCRPSDRKPASTLLQAAKTIAENQAIPKTPIMYRSRYIHYEAPEEEQNFATLLEMLNSMDVREDDEEYQNSVDILFERLREKNPVRQYVKFKMAAGVTE